jgi:hypothetical protein
LEDKLTWDNAKISCESKGGELASVRNDYNYEYLQEISAFERINLWVKIQDLN